MRVSTPGMNRVSQAKPPIEDGDPTRIAFTLEPEDPETVATDAERVENAVRRACSRIRLSDVEIDIDADERVTVTATNPSAFAPSRVVHDVWMHSIENYGTDYRADGRLTWARGGLIDQGEGENEGDLP